MRRGERGREKEGRGGKEGGGEEGKGKGKGRERRRGKERKGREGKKEEGGDREGGRKGVGKEREGKRYEEEEEESFTLTYFSATLHWVSQEGRTEMSHKDRVLVYKALSLHYFRFAKQVGGVSQWSRGQQPHVTDKETEAQRNPWPSFQSQAAVAWREI